MKEEDKKKPGRKPIAGGTKLVRFPRSFLKWVKTKAKKDEFINASIMRLSRKGDE